MVRMTGPFYIRLEPPELYSLCSADMRDAGSSISQSGTDKKLHLETDGETVKGTHSNSQKQLRQTLDLLSTYSAGAKSENKDSLLSYAPRQRTRAHNPSP